MPAFNRFNAWTDTMVEAANCGTDQFAIALTNTAPSASNTVLADITEIAYTGFGSRNLTTTSSSQTGGVYSLVWASLTLGTTVTSATFRYVVIYDDTLAGDPLVGWYDLGVGTTIPANTSLILSSMGLDLDGSSFDPLELFSGGEQGAWYDPSDLSTMFQDTAGTIPVTATGQAVARINDKSGRGNHLFQATAAQRPTLQQDGGGKYYLSFDTIDDVIAATGMTHTTDMDAMFGMYRSGNCVSYMRASGSPAGGYACVVQSGSGASHWNNSGTPNAYVNGVMLSPQTRGQLSTSWPVSTTSVVEFQNADLLTGWSGGFAFGFYTTVSGLQRLYPGILRQNMTAQELLDARAWVAGKCGVTL